MYVVNSFQVTEPGSLVDYGPYESVRNLTDLTDITLENDNEVHFEAESKQDFFYQGTLDNQALPWNISITYVLDGERSEEHTSELQSRGHLVCRLLLEKKKKYVTL